MAVVPVKGLIELLGLELLGRLLSIQISCAKLSSALPGRIEEDLGLLRTYTPYLTGNYKDPLPTTLSYFLTTMHPDASWFIVWSQCTKKV